MDPSLGPHAECEARDPTVRDAQAKSVILQREIAERLLLTALRETELADIAEASRGRTAFLLDAGRRLGESLDESKTRDIISSIALPTLGSWCIVDVVEARGEVTRLAMLHPDLRKQEILDALAIDWTPGPGDLFGAAAILHNPKPVVSTVAAKDVAAVFSAVTHNPDNLRLLVELGAGPLLTVPMVSHDKVMGAITFVSGQPGRAYSRDDVELAEGLAARCAEALNSSRLYGDAVRLRQEADASSRSRMRFLGDISHELRTPLNAIMGYTHLMESEIHGPINANQRHDLERIRSSQEHLLVLITDILDFVRAGLVPVTKYVALAPRTAVAQVVAMLDILATQKAVICRNEVEDDGVLVETDPDRLQQVLINLISNAIKFTPAEGAVTIRSVVVGKSVEISVTDTGIGIASDMIEAIFEPFIQVEGVVGTGGVGLGLAISRDLARTMRGDLQAKSVLGEGSCFTLTLPLCFPASDQERGQSQQ